MKTKEFLKDFFTSKKIVTKDILLYAFWTLLVVSVISKIWTLASSQYTMYWDFGNYVGYIFNIFYDVFVLRIAYEVLTALFDIHENTKKSKKTKSK